MGNNKKFTQEYKIFQQVIISNLNKLNRRITNLESFAVSNREEINSLKEMQNERISTLESKANAFQNQVNALQDQMSIRGRW